ncbi:MAG: hypothetical protein NTW21_40175 [Verrucomicrobia bacterium]|nr:hypothetical protein [Verrucomicrobiota bacterium]
MLATPIPSAFARKGFAQQTTTATPPTHKQHVSRLSVRLGHSATGKSVINHSTPTKQP